MKTLLFYLLQVFIASGILYGYYHLMLRNKRFHQYNRFYLLAAAVISALIPFLNIPVYFAESEIQSSRVLQTLQTISSSGFENETVITAASPGVTTSFNWDIVLYIIYTFAAFLLLTRILVSFKKIITIIKSNPVEELAGVRFVNTTEPGTPYSFFSWLFWNKKIELHSEKGEQIFRHEIYHIQQKHSFDILLMELLTTFFWINPFFHLMKKELKAIHEFLADRFAAHKTDKWEYAELLLMQALNTQQQLVNPFFHNQIKRRITMITNPQKTSHRYLRKLLVLPVAAILVSLFAFKYKNINTAAATPRFDETITIVVDAGHGGIDPGALSVDKKYTEAQLTLEMAKAIQKLADEYNIRVVMTRENDNLPGNAFTIDEGLKKRIEISEMAKPVAFISLHMNAVPVVKTKNESAVKNDAKTGLASRASGAEVYVTGKKEDKQSNLLASAVLQSVSSILPVTEKSLQRREGGAYVLDKNRYPAIILQCAYITNAADLDFILKPDNQEKLARSILTAVISYKNQLKEKADKLSRDTIPGKTSMGNAKTDSSVVKAKEIKLLPDQDVLSKSLVVIDGIVKGNMNMADLNEINVGDIESIDILKGASAIAKYGDKGKFGVIEIVSKKGKKPEVKEVWVEDTKSQGTENKIFSKVEIDPSFPGGETGWKKYLERNLNSSMAAQNNAPAGEYTIYVQFIVHTNGEISDIKALTNHGFGMEEEAIKLIKKGPRWVAAIQNGKAVNAYKKQRVDFVSNKGTLPADQEWLNASRMPVIKLADLKKATVQQLLKVEEGTEIAGFNFTIDNRPDVVTESKNTGGRFNTETIELIKNATAGNTIMIDVIRIIKSNKEIKIPSKVYHVVD